MVGQPAPAETAHAEQVYSTALRGSAAASSPIVASWQRCMTLHRLAPEEARTPVRLEVDPARMRPADVPYLVADVAAIARDTGWKATIPLEVTLADVLEEQRAAVAN